MHVNKESTMRTLIAITVVWAVVIGAAVAA
jgi:hypothetical protein